VIEHFHLSGKVAAAIRKLEPIVVIESTVWVHGLPPQHSLRVLADCIRIIEEENACPAVAILSRGRIMVGADVRDIEDFVNRGQCRKVNIRDIPSVLQKGQDGATTVSASIFIAATLGLPVCMTGGIGGVHRNAAMSFDVSADLQALESYPVTLVSSGVKSVLDVGATLEKMESLGIPVLCYRTKSFPIFYSSSSEFEAPETVDSVEAAAEIIRIHRSLGNNRGVLIANPIPESASLSESLVKEVTEKAMTEMQELGIRGKDVTPFLLSRLHDSTGGDTIKANVALLKSNARLAAKLSNFIVY